jgi:hypothetical protein
MTTDDERPDGDTAEQAGDRPPATGDAAGRPAEPDEDTHASEADHPTDTDKRHHHRHDI